MKEIEWELRPLMIARDEQHGNTRPHKIRKGPNQLVKDFSLDVVLVKKVSAMNEKIGPHFNGVLHDRDKILKDGVRPILPSHGIRLCDLGNLESEMGIRRMNELQNALSKTQILNASE